MPETDKQSLPYPDYGTPDTPKHIEDLALAVESKLVQFYPTMPSVEALNPSPSNGEIIYVQADNAHYVRRSSGWKVLTRESESSWTEVPLKPIVSTQGTNILEVRKVGDSIFSRGRVEGAITSGTAIATLPETFRPSTLTEFFFTRNATSATSAALVRGEINTLGDLIPWFGSSTVPAPAWLGLPAFLCIVN